MIGTQDYVCYFDWTFEYLRCGWGEDAVMEFWTKSIFVQRQAWPRLKAKGIRGAAEHWGWQLQSEQAGNINTLADEYFRIDMYDCPSKGLLMERGQQCYHDYCNHCIAWINPICEDTSLRLDHAHNHRGQCWWEFSPATVDSTTVDEPPTRGDFDVRLRGDWSGGLHDRWLAGRSSAKEG